MSPRPRPVTPCRVEPCSGGRRLRPRLPARDGGRRDRRTAGFARRPTARCRGRRREPRSREPCSRGRVVRPPRRPESPPSSFGSSLEIHAPRRAGCRRPDVVSETVCSPRAVTSLRRSTQSRRSPRGVPLGSVREPGTDEPPSQPVLGALRPGPWSGVCGLGTILEVERLPKNESTGRVRGRFRKAVVPRGVRDRRWGVSARG